MSCYIVQETDGSRFELEDDSGFLLLEFCPPAGGELPMGGDLAALPVRRGRRRRRELILDDDEIMSVLLDEL